MKNKITAVLKDKRLYIGLGGLVVLGALFLVLLDTVIMPAYTNYNEGTTVPDISQMALEDAKKELTNRGLRYEVADRRANEAYPADYVIDQTPEAAKIVKPDRKIYLTVNIETNPTVQVPKVVDLSFRNARIQLQNNGLEVGTVSYESSRFKNSVLKQSTPPETVVPRGTIIDLTVSDGLGGNLVNIPDIEGLSLSEAQQKLQERGLRVKEIEFRPSLDVPPNTVLSYTPAKNQLLEGEMLKLIISEKYGDTEESESGAVIDTTRLN